MGTLGLATPVGSGNSSDQIYRQERSRGPQPGLKGATHWIAAAIWALQLKALHREGPELNPGQGSMVAARTMLSQITRPARQFSDPNRWQTKMKRKMHSTYWVTAIAP